MDSREGCTWFPITRIRPPEVIRELINTYDESLDPQAREWWYSQFLATVDAALSQYSAPSGVWYLDYLGVLPEYQRRGIAKALVLPLREQAKLEGWKFALTTQTLENVRFYESLGFRIGRTLVIPGSSIGDVTVYVMVNGFDDG
ncbi:hypothetical protein BDN72DRAFT_308155 [Pluteus cervinus]|uniref:Uncharacterized protein n=1 Tax=Pluteus cervinus TaxID=181527 RepID=A0ACD3ADW5_9AGAR|nr:hypothetical protein BDN72DRAFT_308155 [Pluteus cervinus]